MMTNRDMTLKALPYLTKIRYRHATLLVAIFLAFAKNAGMAYLVYFGAMIARATQGEDVTAFLYGSVWFLLAPFILTYMIYIFFRIFHPRDAEKAI